MAKSMTDSRDKMPQPRPMRIQLLPTGQSEQFYLERFMRELGEDRDGTALIDAPSGHRLSVSELLFTNHKQGGLKITKKGRAPYVPYIAATIKRPDEIRLTTGDFGDRSLFFLSRYEISRELIGVLVVFIECGPVWEGWTGYQMPLKSTTYFESKRKGKLIYRRLET
jgi:hypothetical protein